MARDRTIVTERIEPGRNQIEGDVLRRRAPHDDTDEVVALPHSLEGHRPTRCHGGCLVVRGECHDLDVELIGYALRDTTESLESAPQAGKGELVEEAPNRIPVEGSNDERIGIDVAGWHVVDHRHQVPVEEHLLAGRCEVLLELRRLGIEVVVERLEAVVLRDQHRRRLLPNTGNAGKIV